MENPFFSIVIPTFNRSELIGKTIQSVLNQEFKNFELLIVDDGSTDNTEGVIHSFLDDRIRYFKKENEERGAARNYGGQKAKGQFITFLDSDDLIYQNHLKEAYQFIEDKEDIAVFYQKYELILSNGDHELPYQPKNTIVNNELLLKGNFMSCHGVFIKKEVFLKNMFNPARELAGSEDYELWLRLSSRFPIYFSPIISSALVEHSNRSVITMDSSKVIQRKQLMLKSLRQDPIFLKKYGSFLSQIEAESFSYISLHLALGKEKRGSLHFLYKAILNDFSHLFKKRTFVTLFHLIK